MEISTFPWNKRRYRHTIWEKIIKDKRTVLEINDFSGGLVTNVPIISLETKFTPDCINVFGEGTKLVKRKGFSKHNTNTVAAGSPGNGIFNWFKSNTNHLLMAVFGAKLYSMDLGGTVWDGTFDAVSADATSGRAWADSITHFATFQGTLLMVNELRSHPQRMNVTDTSHFDIEAGGTGTAPDGKYINVWKEHVWIMNIAAGGALDEDMAAIADWSDDDVGGGASTQVTTDGLSAMKLVGLSGASASHAIRTRDVGTIEDSYILEMKMNFGLLEGVSGTTTSLGHSIYKFGNGVVDLNMRYTSDGAELFDGSAFNEVGVGLVTESVWNTWKFVVTGGTATDARVTILKDDVYIGIGLDVTNAASLNDGSIDLTAQAGTGTGATAYIDYIKINDSTPQTEYFKDGDFGDWDDTSTPTTPNLVAEPVQPLVHYKVNDNASSDVVLNAGVEAAAGTLFADATTLDTDQISTAGKVNQAFALVSASSHHFRLNTTSVTSLKDDDVGTISMWLKPDGSPSQQLLFSLGDTNVSTRLSIELNAGSQIRAFMHTADIIAVDCHSTVTAPSGTYVHLAVVQDGGGGGPKFYMDGVLDTTVFDIDTDKDAWYPEAGGSALDRGQVGAFINSLGNVVVGYNGEIDDVRMYSTALTGQQIIAIYADGSGSEAQATTNQEGTTPTAKIGTFSYEFSNDTGHDVVAVGQTITSATALAGVESVTGAWFFATNNATYKIRVQEGSINHDSAIFTATATWHYNTFKFTPTSSATTLFWKVISTSAATIRVDQVSIEKQNVSTTDDKADRIQRSAVGLFNDWSGTDSGTNDITTDGDIGLTGSFIHSDKLYVMKKYSMHRLTYTGSTPLIAIKQMRSRMGTASPRSIRTITLSGQGEVVIFFGTDRRLYQFDGFDTTVISANIELNNGITSTYLNNVNTQALDKVFAVVHDDNPWYEIFLPIGNSILPDFSIIYDYEAKAFWPMGNRNFKAGGESDDGSGQRVVYVQDTTSGFAHLTRSTNTDDGSSINGNWVSSKIGDSTILSRMDEIDLVTENVGTVQPTLQWREDFNETYTSVTLSSSSNLHNYNPNLTDNYIQFRINDDSKNTEFQIWKLRALAKGLGHGK